MEQPTESIAAAAPEEPIEIYKKDLIPESVFELPPQDVYFVKRRLIDDGKLRCFCLGNDGKQLEASRSSNTVFGCNNVHKMKNPDGNVCGFRMNISPLKFLKQYNILAHQNELTVPICKKCLVSWLLLSESTKIPNYVGNLGYSCECQPYVTRINFPVNDKAVAQDFNVSNWLKGKLALYTKTYNKETTQSAKKEVEKKEPKYYVPY